MDTYLLASVCDGFGMGLAGSIPWKEPRGEPADAEHLRLISRLTRDPFVVVMGRRTWERTRDDAHAPSEGGRLDVVVTSTPSRFRKRDPAMRSCVHVVFVAEEDLSGLLSSLRHGFARCYVVGGPALMRRFLPSARGVHLKHVEGRYACDAFFPAERLSELGFVLATTGEDVPVTDVEGRSVPCRELVYVRTIAEGALPTKATTGERGGEGEAAYLALAREVLQGGDVRPDRTGVGTRSLFARQLRFDLRRGAVPILTTKRMAWKTVAKELLWFLRGRTDAGELAAQGVGIWAGNTSRAFLDARGLAHYREGDVGPLYPHALRHFGAPYAGCDADYTGRGVDQVQRLIEGLRREPHSRRHLLTTFDPTAVDQCVLPPCHGIAVQFYVTADRGLSCHVYCRSSDVFLGLPFNIASYALLVHVVAARCGGGLVPHELVLSTGDTHLYRTHERQMEEQLRRAPYPSPLLRLSPDVATKPWDELDVDDFELRGYFCHPPIAAPMAV